MQYSCIVIDNEEETNSESCDTCFIGTVEVEGDLFEVVNYQAVLGEVSCLKLRENLVLKILKIWF